MRDSNDVLPENIIIIKDEYYYCTDNLIYKGDKCQIYGGREKTSNMIDSNNSYSPSLSICVKKEPPFLQYPKLIKESSNLKKLQKFLEKDENGNIPCPFIPKMYNYYPSSDTPSFLVEELLGNSVDSIFKMCNRKFSIMSSLIIVKQILKIIQNLHEKGIIHRNLNPIKFLFGKEETTDIIMDKFIKKEIHIDPSSQLYLVDYSEAKFFTKDFEKKEEDNTDNKIPIDNLGSNKFENTNNINETKLNNNTLEKESLLYNSDNHIDFDDKVKDFSFTNKYFCSIWAELKMEQSRRDDLYSIFYILIYLLVGKLPWIGIKGKNKEDRREKIRNLKLCLSNFELCKNVDKVISNEVGLFIFYLNSLSFEDEPNYIYLNKLIEEMEKKVADTKNIEYTSPIITIRN